VADTWKDWLWDGVRGVYNAILEHPFLVGLGDGTLQEARFVYYIAQDAAYLRDYARALSVIAAKAPSHADTAMLSAHAADTADVELALRETLVPALGIDPAQIAVVEVSPTTRAYTSHLLATTHAGTFAEGLAAVLPCYWIYHSVGTELVTRGSVDPRYQIWIDTYSGEEFKTTVDEVLDLADRVGPNLPAAEAWRTREHFYTTARYEWMFWDAAWREEIWPI